MKLQLGKVDERLMRLTDAFVDGDVDREIYQRRKDVLLMEQAELEETAQKLRAEPAERARELRTYLELARIALLSYELGNVEDKRALLRELTSNWTIQRKDAVVELQSPYREIAERSEIFFCGEKRTRLRRLSKVTGAATDSFIETLFLACLNLPKGSSPGSDSK